MKANVAILKNERTAVWVLVWLIIGISLLYVYFMNETVFTVAKRAHLEQELSMRASSISALEFKSISLRNDIDIELAHSLGYQKIDPRYISKTPITALAVQTVVQ